jgi:hypothetical protein
VATTGAPTKPAGDPTSVAGASPPQASPPDGADAAPTTHPTEPVPVMLTDRPSGPPAQQSPQPATEAAGVVPTSVAPSVIETPNVDPSSADLAALFHAEKIVYDQAPVVIEDVDAASIGTIPDSPDADADMDVNLVTISRRVLYFQGGLIGGVALFAFIFGFLLGGIRDGQSPNMKPVTLAGRITFEDAAAESLPDVGAVVVALPEGRVPESGAKIPIAGLHPLSPEPPPGDPMYKAIEAAGSAYARADARGRYRLVLPTAGKYHLLVVSRGGAGNSSDATSNNDLAVLGRYFQSAYQLIESQKYHRMKPQRLDDDQEINHHFRR